MNLGQSQDYLNELLKRAQDPEHPGQRMAVYNLYLAAENANARLEDLRASTDARRDRASVAVAELGKLILSTPPARQSSELYKRITEIWRTACHG